MASHVESARKEIEPYLDREVIAELDGKLFAHRPARFAFRFAEPSALVAELIGEYDDYLADWDLAETVPVAAVRKAGSDYEFAWLFLDWSEGNESPRVLVTTTDRWEVDDAYTMPSLADMGLEVA